MSAMQNHATCVHVYIFSSGCQGSLSKHAVCKSMPWVRSDTCVRE